MPGGGDGDVDVVAVTGATGFLGSRLVDAFRRRGCRVIAMSRSSDGDDSIPFRLGLGVSRDALRRGGVRALVHCAYDFTLTRWSEIDRINVGGSRLLFEAAAAAGVDTIVDVSSISAFPGATSLYGRAKLETEDAAQGVGAVVLRPGLIWADDPDTAGGMFGALAAAARRPILPIIGSGRYPQYLVHIDDLVDVVIGVCEGTISPAQDPLIVAAPAPVVFTDLVRRLAEPQRSPHLVRVPWRIVRAGLRAAELTRLPLGFRSDSVTSLVHHGPAPDATTLARLGIACREFLKADPGMGMCVEPLSAELPPRPRIPSTESEGADRAPGHVSAISPRS